MTTPCAYSEHAQWGWGEDHNGDPDPSRCRVCNPDAEVTA